jgi:thiol-disulfide isomerase/thioredoxin
LLLTGVFVAVVAAGLAAAWLIGDRGDAVEPDVAPDFTVDLLDGGTFTLSEHLAEDGRPLILNLWASWCVPCRVEIPDISAYSESTDDVAVLGVAVEDRLEDSVAFANEVQASYPLAFGNEDFRISYPSLGLPATYFIDSDGTIASIFNGIVTEETLAKGFD